MSFWFPALLVAVVAFSFFGWVLCAMGGQADDRIERMLEVYDWEHRDVGATPDREAGIPETGLVSVSPRRTGQAGETTGTDLAELRSFGAQSSATQVPASPSSLRLVRSSGFTAEDLQTRNRLYPEPEDISQRATPSAPPKGGVA